MQTEFLQSGRHTYLYIFFFGDLSGYKAPQLFCVIPIITSHCFYLLKRPTFYSATYLEESCCNYIHCSSYSFSFSVMSNKHTHLLKRLMNSEVVPETFFSGKSLEKV